MTRSRYLLFFLFFLGCIEPYEFVITDDTKTIVIEALISDKSFTETVAYPSDGRYFTVKLSVTSDVTNVRDVPITGALVRLISESGNIWDYSAMTQIPGLYELVDDEFYAESTDRYKLIVSVGEELYESEWEMLPTPVPPPMGNIAFNETERQTFVVEANERVIRTVKEITTDIDLPENNSGDKLYYRWKFAPTWIYKAPLSPGVTDPGYICWATDGNYLNNYTLQADLSGGYKKSLFSLPTIRNERIFEDLSVLITQYTMTANNFTFWEEMQAQAEGNSLIDQPPFNLATNFTHVNGSKRVSGYFSVVREDAKRWYFNKSELSYAVENTLKADCLVYYGPPAPGCPIPSPPAACECKYCLAYSFGTTTNVEPAWWGR